MIQRQNIGMYLFIGIPMILILILTIISIIDNNTIHYKTKYIYYEYNIEHKIINIDDKAIIINIDTIPIDTIISDHLIKYRSFTRSCN